MSGTTNPPTAYPHPSYQQQQIQIQQPILTGMPIQGQSGPMYPTDDKQQQQPNQQQMYQYQIPFSNMTPQYVDPHLYQLHLKLQQEQQQQQQQQQRQQPPVALPAERHACPTCRCVETNEAALKNAALTPMDLSTPSSPISSVPPSRPSSSGSYVRKTPDLNYIPATNGSRLGYTLKDFKMVQTIGTGTFGRVYICKLQQDQKEGFFAMKVLKKLEVVRLKQVEHINSEKEILSQVRFPFIVNMFCTFQDEKSVYMLLEYVPGGELFSHLRRAGRFPNEVAKFYVAEISLAIEYLHSLNIIYRDLKPENLLLDVVGHIKITDFGFAKKVEDRTWTLCGTPEYLAPEIISSKGHGKPVDWWALGILTFEMLAGYPPFFDDSAFGIYEKILAGRIAWPQSFDPNAKDFVKKLLTNDRSKRLGNLKGGAEDVRKHKWFRGVDWIAVLNKRIVPPIRPVLRHPGDTSNFERYPEISEDESSPCSDMFRDLFMEF